MELFARRTAALTLIALQAVVHFWLPSHPAITLTSAAVWSLVAGGLWWHWNRLTMWPIWSRWAAVPGLCWMLFTSPLAVVALVAAGWAVSEAVRLVTTRPVTAALIASSWEIPFPLRGLTLRLCVRADRLVLDSLASRLTRSWGVVAVPWSALRSIELIEVEQDTVCEVLLYSGGHRADAREFDVPRGPALHITGTARELLIPVTREVGELVLAAVAARSAGVEVDEVPLTEVRWALQEPSPAPSLSPERLFGGAVILLIPLFVLVMRVVSQLTHDLDLQRALGVSSPLTNDDAVRLVVISIFAIVFVQLLERSVLRDALDMMGHRAFVEAFPEPPPAEPDTEPEVDDAPVSSRKRKRRRKKR